MARWAAVILTPAARTVLPALAFSPVRRMCSPRLVAAAGGRNRNRAFKFLGIFAFDDRFAIAWNDRSGEDPHDRARFHLRRRRARYTFTTDRNGLAIPKVIEPYRIAVHGRNVRCRAVAIGCDVFCQDATDTTAHTCVDGHEPEPIGEGT